MEVSGGEGRAMENEGIRAFSLVQIYVLLIINLYFHRRENVSRSSLCSVA